MTDRNAKVTTTDVTVTDAEMKAAVGVLHFYLSPSFDVEKITRNALLAAKRAEREQA